MMEWVCLMVHGWEGWGCMEGVKLLRMDESMGRSYCFRVIVLGRKVLFVFNFPLSHYFLPFRLDSTHVQTPSLHLHVLGPKDDQETEQYYSNYKQRERKGTHQRRWRRSS